MCSIIGFCNFEEDIAVTKTELEGLGKTLAHRGPDQNGVFINERVAFGHNRLAVIDIEKGLQPMSVKFNGFTYIIIYNGEIYNTNELRNEIISRGVELSTHCDTEIVLYSYILWGKECSKKLNGIFAFAIFDEKENQVYFSRDRFGVKPFFYTIINDKIMFSSEIKGLLAHKEVRPELSQEGLCELVFLSPMRVNGKGLFKNIFEIQPATHGTFDKEGLKLTKYWELEAKEIGDSEKTIIEKTRFLLKDAIEKQLVSDVPLCTFLSGGLDSSIISSVASEFLKKDKKILSTYSFEYEDNKKYFSSNLFQPQSDDEFALYVAKYLETKHKVLTATTNDLVELLDKAVLFRDMPGMADIDSSLLYYCKKVKEEHTVALSGECADEIFGGYPWFYREDMLSRDFFPWIHSPLSRASIFKDDIVNPQKGFEYVQQIYLDNLKNCPLINGESTEMKNSRIATFLSVNWFMTSLLERKDRMSMSCGLEVRVPFADHRILEYVYNIPWEIKFKNQTEKWLLRETMKDYLPEKILNRKKSPYPKTRNPQYESIVLEKLKKTLSCKDSVLSSLLCDNVIDKITGDNDSTWFGQLMSRPQLIAWLLQLDFWFREYDVVLVF